MKILQPYYYTDFKCIAEKCKDSCCIGWRVPIDKKSFIKYEKVKGKFANTLNNNIRKNDKIPNDFEYGQMILNNDDKRCKFLNCNNLCDIYINLGEEYLCYTCSVFPRTIRKYGDIIEKNLELSCPKVSEELINKTEPFSFEMIEDSSINQVEIKSIIEKEYDKELHNLLWEARNFSIYIAQNNEIPLWKRLLLIKLAEERFQYLIDSKNYVTEYNEIEKIKQEIINQSSVSFEFLNVNNEVKIRILSGILHIDIIRNSQNQVFQKILSNYNEFIKKTQNENMQLKLEETRIEFEKYFEDKEYILENYIVYILYSTYMRVLITKDINKEIIRLMISYSIIKMFLISTWIKNDYELTNEEIRDILYSTSRNLEHNEELIKAVYFVMKEQGLDSISNLASMIY